MQSPDVGLNNTLRGRLPGHDSGAGTSGLGEQDDAPSRFSRPALSPVGSERAWRGWGWPRWLRVPLRPVRLLDWALLALEVASALVVAWLAFQYVYTAYFYNPPRRVPAPPETNLPLAQPSVGPTGVAGTPTATPTRFAEVAPLPEIGGPELEGTVATATPTPTVSPELLLPNRLRIPVMFLDSPVHEVYVNMGEWEVSPMEIGHHAGTANPGEVGNVVLAGHRDINSALFRELDRLEPGDEVFVSNSMGEYRYIVQESFVVNPDQTEVMEPTTDKRVTLITCTPIGLSTQRLIVVAQLDETWTVR